MWECHDQGQVSQYHKLPLSVEEQTRIIIKDRGVKRYE